MKITILTIFPNLFDSLLKNTIIQRAISNNLVSINIVNIRDYTKDKYKRVDTPPIGGGSGLIMKCQPIVDAIRSNSNENTHKILLSPKGRTFNQVLAQNYSKMNDLLIVCGNYEGIDERVDNYVDELVSLGDFILTGGETAIMVMSDSIIRLINGVISEDSIKEESFSSNLLEYPQYTLPYDYQGHTIPDILFSGNHQAIEKWRQKQSLVLTRQYRPDLFEKYSLSKGDKKLLEEYDNNIEPSWETKALEKGKKFLKK